MGINVALVDERGAILGHSGDPEGRLYALLPLDRDADYPFLTSIDPYGDTVFNRIQMDRFLTEWAYTEAIAETKYEKTLVALVRQMGARCRDEVHLYLKFIGD